ncbi:MAG: WhiB family transcriptional regulator [Actinobacteria bacterium]|nr:WhiB family transcriptional regulator [Actinomycetota bacterium]MCB9388787.1 WhiB family transcriptional regulator [Acidimicrobiia bacterium]
MHHTVTTELTQSQASSARTQGTEAGTATEAHWASRALCAGRTQLFFPRPGERPEARERREKVAAQYCARCPVSEPCRLHARVEREYGYWGGESEEQRANAGFQVRLPVGRAARRAARAAREAEEAGSERPA